MNDATEAKLKALARAFCNYHHVGIDLERDEIADDLSCHFIRAYSLGRESDCRTFLHYEMAPAVDLANTWARESGVQEIDRPEDFRDLVSRLWDAAGRERVKLLTKIAKYEQALDPPENWPSNQP